ncbi:MAG: S-layer homology domain-containing protein [Clostridia bacterium]|nr:S-layer homology domain-containing protein [Clostridia bacterium]
MRRIFTLFAVSVLLATFSLAAFEKVNTYNNNFSDVADSNWFAENVKTAYELGFMNGKSEGKFDPDGNVTVAEGITMASRLHAIYNGAEITKNTVPKNEYRFDFDTLDGVVFNHAYGEVKDGVLVMQPDAPNSYGNYDPGIKLSGILLDSRRYNRMTIRMKRDELPNTNPDIPRSEKLEIYFATDVEPTYAESRTFKPSISDIDDLTQWFEVEIALDENSNWQNTISAIRFDPTNNNGIYYIDSIVLWEDLDSSNSKWYDMYVDYALANGIIAKAQYTNNDFSRNITRAEICDLFVASLPEEYFGAINNIKGIPDVLRDEKNADVYLMLYNAGVLLGSDAEGTFNPKSDIKRSEIAAIINRVALPENRVKGRIEADWSKQGNEYDIEFNDEGSLSNIETKDVDYTEIKNGALIIQSTDRGANRLPQFDPKIVVNDINVNADEFSKLKVRMKVDFLGDIDSTKFDFYFMTEGDKDFSEAKSAHQDFREFSYIDPAGWYVMEVDLGMNAGWSGNITSFRFDPANTNGVYTIDYLRLAKGDPLQGASHEKLLSEGYTATRLMQDEGFERGFYIAKTDQTAGLLNHGIWQEYCETDEKPLWGIGPWWQGTGDGLTMVDLWEDRDTTTDKYTLADKYGVNTIKYNPEEKSISMRLNATNIYHGQPHIKDDKSTPDVDESNYKWWPHLLIEQTRSICPIDKERNSAASDRMFIELDAKITDFKATTNPEGANVCDFLAYFYLKTDKAPGQMIWFGIQIFSGANLNMPVHNTGWSPDSAANQYMYGIRMNTLYDGMENSFNPENGVALVGDDWKHIRLDVTPHIETAVAWANRDNIFGVQVTKEDMYFDGVNIGYEIHGNYDCTVEFKNFNMVSYDKAD